MGHQDGVLANATNCGLAHTGYGLQFQKGNHSSGNHRDDKQTSTRGGKTALWQGVLQQGLRRPQTKWKMEAHNRFEKVEPVHQDTEVQNGVHTNSMDSASARKLRLFNRPHRRLLSCTSSSKLQKVPQNILQRESVSIQSTPLRAEHSSLSVHKNYVRGKGHSTSTRNPVVSVPRRLVGSRRYLPKRCRTKPLHDKLVSRTRSPNQSEEVRARTSTKLRLHRSALQLAIRESISQRRESDKVKGQNQAVPLFSIGECQGISVSFGKDGSSVSLHPECQTVHEANPMAYEAELGSDRGRSSRAHKHISSGKSMPKVVVETDQQPSRSSSSAPYLPDAYVHRCVREGLGGTCSECTGHKVPRPVVNRRITDAHEQTGVEGSETSSITTQSCPRAVNSDIYRQYNSGSPYKQTRGHTLMGLNGRDSMSLSACHDKPMANQSCTHSRETQCNCRQSVQSGTDNSYRVESSPSGSRTNLSEMVHSSHRPLRNEVQLQVSDFRVPCAGHDGISSRCPVTKPTGDGGICLSSISDTPEVVTELPEDNSLLTNRDSSLVAKTVMVPHTLVTSRGKTISVTPLEEATKTAKLPNIPQQSGSSQSARLLAQEAALIQGGFDEDVARKIANPVARTTSKVYNAKWNLWKIWAESQNRDPNQPDIPLIAKFLNKLFQDGQSCSSIAGYRSALASSLKFTTVLDVSHSEELARLMQCFLRMRPPQSRIRPKWDLAIVLWTMLEEPFEPVWDEKKCPLKFLTWKVAFLLLLASGARRGELHAIPYKNVSVQKDADYVTLRPENSYMNKTRAATGKVLPPFVIPSLKKHVGEHSQDRKLCPVRAVQAYLHRTKPEFRKDRKLFLVSYSSAGDNSEKDIALNTLSTWISSLIAYCYKQPGKQAIKLTGRNTHEVRAYAASLVNLGVPNLEDLLAAGQWTNELTFINHYLRDLTEQQGALSRLGPIVAGKKVVQI